MKSLLFFLLSLLFVIPASAQDYALEQLENSPRHHEWVELESAGRTLYNFVAYPEVSDAATIFIVIHENRGLNDWARSFTDQLAEKGFIAIAPDLLSNSAEGIQKTSDFENSDAARTALYGLDPDVITTDLKNVIAYAKSLEAGNGEVIIVGFCWGGSQSFRFATNAEDDITAAMVFYGTGPSEKAEYENIQVPVYGFYGGADNRVNATIPNSDEAMTEFDKTFEYEIYEGAGHAYMRSGDNPETPTDNPNVKARNASWERIMSIMRSL